MQIYFNINYQLQNDQTIKIQCFIYEMKRSHITLKVFLSLPVLKPPQPQKMLKMQCAYPLSCEWLQYGWLDEV